MVQNISNSAVVHFFDNLMHQCSKSVAKNPGNRMLGWRNFVDGKVSTKKYLFESSVSSSFDD